MHVVALDPSLTCTGFCDSREPTYPGVIVPRGGMRGPARTYWIGRQVDQLTDGADLVLIEGYAFGAKGRALFDIAELGGVLRQTLWCRRRTYVEVPPANLKIIATGKGNSKKDAVLAEAIRRLGYEGNDHNEADAMWLLQAALNYYDLPGAVDLPKTHLRGLDKVKWPVIETAEDRRSA